MEMGRLLLLLLLDTTTNVIGWVAALFHQSRFDYPQPKITILLQDTKKKGFEKKIFYITVCYRTMALGWLIGVRPPFSLTCRALRKSS